MDNVRLNTNPLYYGQFHAEHVVFRTRIKSGRGERDVTLFVQAALITALAEAIRVTGHAGHAVWHICNDRPIPCSSCATQVPTHPGDGSND